MEHRTRSTLRKGVPIAGAKGEEEKKTQKREGKFIKTQMLPDFI
jgi:hypothetical protein